MHFIDFNRNFFSGCVIDVFSIIGSSSGIVRIFPFSCLFFSIFLETKKKRVVRSFIKVRVVRVTLILIGLSVLLAIFLDAKKKRVVGSFIKGRVVRVTLFLLWLGLASHTLHINGIERSV